MKRKLASSLSAALVLAGALYSGAAHAAWEIDPSHTHVSFQVWHLGLTQTPGRFDKATAQMSFDDQKIETSTVSFNIDAASIDTAHAARDTDLRGPKWLDVKQYPTIQFVSTQVKRVDDKNYLISGSLTIHGKTRPVDFSAILTNRAINPFLNVPMIGFIASAKIKRSDFGMDQFPAAIGDEVDLKVALELLKKP